MKLCSELIIEPPRFFLDAQRLKMGSMGAVVKELSHLGRHRVRG